MSHRILLAAIVAILILVCTPAARADSTALLTKDGAPLFPIGFYELPGDDAALATMVGSGANLVRCGGKADLDRVQAAGAQGWLPLPLQAGATDKLRAQIEAVKDHPALAVWEGPDEVVWNFTAYSGLHKSLGVYENKDEWWNQTPRAIEYSESKAAEILPNMKAAVALVRSLDTRSRPMWMNEALKSDVKFVRQYLPFVDIVGCDIYPVSGRSRKVENMGGATDRWNQVGKGKPVWMVLQAFSWDELGDDYTDRGTAYPSFAESRFMAYDVIAHGARGIMYWGSSYLKSHDFRNALYALTSELAGLNAFLVAPELTGAHLQLIELPEEKQPLGVAMAARRAGDDWLIILVNEDDAAHMGVEVSGLSGLDGRTLHLLYGTETAQVSDGEFVVRLQPKEVKVFCTTQSVETTKRDFRDYAGE